MAQQLDNNGLGNRRQPSVVLVVKHAIIVFLVGCMLPGSGQCAESGWNEVGVRIGIQAGTKHEYFHQYEAFGIYGLPWDWRAASGWGVTPYADISLGVLEGGGESSVIGSVGPTLDLNKKGSGVSADIGINANLLDRRRFGSQDFGSILQFGAKLGVNYRFDNGLKISYHIQHISNGHILYPNGTPNPGLDMHMLGISYVF